MQICDFGLKYKKMQLRISAFKEQREDNKRFATNGVWVVD